MSLTKTGGDLSQTNPLGTVTLEVEIDAVLSAPYTSTLAFTVTAPTGETGESLSVTTNAPAPGTTNVSVATILTFGATPGIYTVTATLTATADPPNPPVIPQTTTFTLYCGSRLEITKQIIIDAIAAVSTVGGYRTTIAGVQGKWIDPSTVGSLPQVMVLVGPESISSADTAFNILDSVAEIAVVGIVSQAQSEAFLNDMKRLLRSLALLYVNDAVNPWQIKADKPFVKVYREDIPASNNRFASLVFSVWIRAQADPL